MLIVQQFLLVDKNLDETRLTEPFPPTIVSSWSEHPLLTTAEEATETLINLAGLQLCDIGGAEAGLQEGDTALLEQYFYLLYCRWLEQGIEAKMTIQSESLTPPNSVSCFLK